MLRTPKHNEKVERSHRNDNEKFYDYLKFYSLEDLIKKEKAYLQRSNNIQNSCSRLYNTKIKKNRIKTNISLNV